MTAGGDAAILVPIIGRKDLATQYLNEALIAPRLDDAIDDWLDTQPAPPEPEVIEHTIDTELQTGDSALLGGAMEIKAPWERD